MIAIILGMSGTVLAAKPVRDFTMWSNGFPSGEHFNLNIHGKKDTFVCNSTPGGGSVFVPEYGESLIQLIQNKKSSVEDLTVLDPCSSGPDDPAKVQLPAGEYQVYARILAKPGKVKDGETRNVAIYPNQNIEACNDSAEGIDGFGDYIDCKNESLMGLGIVTYNGVYDTSSQVLERTTGKSKAVDVSGLFKWSGYACTDPSGDGSIMDEADQYGNGDGITNETEIANYLASTNCTEYTDEWIFNIADLVVYGWDYDNNGAKLVQVRFYPLGATKFT